MPPLRSTQTIPAAFPRVMFKSATHAFARHSPEDAPKQRLFGQPRESDETAKTNSQLGIDRLAGMRHLVCKLCLFRAPASVTASW